MNISSRPVSTWLAALALVAAGFAVSAATVVGPWIPVFKGVDYSVSTNIPGQGDFPRLQVVHAFRVDLTDPDIRLFTTPPISNYVAGSSEVGGLTTSDFLTTYHLQAAINANFFGPGSYYLPAGTPMDVFGLEISEGVTVSEQTGPDHAAAVLFDTNNAATVVHTNWPVVNLNGIYTAVSGDRALVVAGVNIENQPTSTDLDPRTAFGLSQDRRYLYLVGIDGRQPGYSDGANFYETAGWLLLLGAYDGVNVDGGGSTLLVIQDSTGLPIRVSQSSAVADSGRERTVGCHLGIYAKPLPGFINDLVAVPDDTTANITWTTVEPSTTEVEYGVTSQFGTSSGVQTNLLTNHVVQLTGLTPWTGYYFRAISSTATQQYVSSNFYFFTTNYVTTNLVFDVTNSWKYTTTNLDGVNWTGTNYSDSAWSGPGPGLLWIDVRAGGPNANVQPKGTQLPGDPGNNGRPYITYYFRTSFTLTNVVQGGFLDFAAYIDDGAVFYLNGAEIYRLRMPANSDATTLAVGYPCSGDADCLDTFTVPMDSLTNLVMGDNVLAAEVHNYNLQSPDITFGLSLQLIEPVTKPGVDLGLSAVTDTNAVLVGQQVTFMLRLTNAGPNVATQVRVEDALPGGVSVVTTDGTQGSWTNENGVVRWDLGEIAAGGEASMNLVLLAEVPGVVTNVFVAAAQETDVNPGDNGVEVETRIDPVVSTARLDISRSGNMITLSWGATGFILQSADSLDGPWNDVQGNPGSPFSVESLESERFYRLQK